MCVWMHFLFGVCIKRSPRCRACFRRRLDGGEVRVQAVRQGVPVEAEPEAAHPRGPVRQGAAARVPPVRDELQAHQPAEQARDPVPAHRVRRQPRVVLGGGGRRGVRVRVRVVVVVVHGAAHTQAAAPVPGRAAHHRRVHQHHRHRGHVVAVPDHTGAAPEKPESGPELEFQNPKTRQLNNKYITTTLSRRRRAKRIPTGPTRRQRRACSTILLYYCNKK